MDNLIKYINLLDNKYNKTYKYISIDITEINIDLKSKTSRFYKDLKNELDRLNIYYLEYTFDNYEYLITIKF